ncbi:Aspartyl/glutamyl-tRNA(Asn/Gln) amidotransferase subunit B [Mucisphaera calidilacus]|uniref:Aspartyl/glutamyl-tRNA(Asn/Gln) amidotransferase subunit B n=2 Tax=Mucisphaera calidilacus TaxID=2527982 RepID=A0A518BUL7_9BACT|nr:Aspartyl/glutamyl-tRNA(Asn/Gln) amidotransferase subunit B [Mucisphaera calidilacus]
MTLAAADQERFAAMGLTTRLVVGMEIHVELATRSKMWTSSPNVAHASFQDAEPNTLTSPVVIGMPGTLPVMNKRAAEMSIMVGLALNCAIARRCHWDRKSYYYPDLPKNYQISQYEEPICGEGYLDIPVDPDRPEGACKRIRITRAHLEEDAGKLMHEAPGGLAIDHSIVDLNRAGTPLLEIVTEPDFGSAEEAVTFSVMLRDLCRHLGVTQGIMQRGHIRFEPNINVVIEKEGQTYKTPIAEIKNLNSFRAVKGSIEHEYVRQVEQWLEDGRVMSAGAKSTRGWDDNKQVTLLQREKEDAHDYRYFPDPDLVDLVVDEAWLDTIRGSMPRPLGEREASWRAAGVGSSEVRQLLDDPGLARLFDEVVGLGVAPKRALSLLLNAGLKWANEYGVSLGDHLSAAQVAGIDGLLSAEKLGSSGAEKLVAALLDPEGGHDGGEPEAVAERLNLLQVSDSGALEAHVDEVLADARNAKAVEDIRGGKDKAVGALLGQIMKKTGGAANPKVVRDLIFGRLRS